MELVSDNQESQKNKTEENKKHGHHRSFQDWHLFFFFFFGHKRQKD